MLDRRCAPRPMWFQSKTLKGNASMNPSVSTLLLATMLAGCTTASAQQEKGMPQTAATSAAATPAKAGAPSVADVEDFLARAEKELGDYSVTNNQAQWVNATFVSDDTDALATYFGAIGTEMSVRYAYEAAKYQAVQGLYFDV